MEILEYQVREAHRQCLELTDQAGRYRKERDRLIRQLYATGDYSYGQLAKRVGCSVELIAKVVQRDGR
jgi:hypothetical protein